jgi:hypothetical protein
MTPTKKAKLLVQKFYFSLPNNGGETGVCNVHQRWREGKICARIAADELIDSYTKEKSYGYIISDKIIPYWREVKQEIEKL